MERCVESGKVKGKNEDNLINQNNHGGFKHFLLLCHQRAVTFPY